MTEQKISKNIEDLNNTIYPLNLIDFYRTGHQIRAKYIFLSSVPGTFTKTEHILGHKTNLTSLKKLEALKVFL